MVKGYTEKQCNCFCIAADRAGVQKLLRSGEDETVDGSGADTDIQTGKKICQVTPDAETTDLSGDTTDYYEYGKSLLE